MLWHRLLIEMSDNRFRVRDREVEQRVCRVLRIGHFVSVQFQYVVSENQE